MNDELKPCPFCGGKAAIYGADSYFIACCRCEAQTKRHRTAKEATAAWNRRADPENKPPICPLLSDAEVKQPCLEGPCPAILNEPLTLEHVDCKTCQFIERDRDEEPCRHCKGAYLSKYAHKPEGSEP